MDRRSIPAKITLPRDDNDQAAIMQALSEGGLSGSSPFVNAYEQRLAEHFSVCGCRRRVLRHGSYPLRVGRR